MNQELTENHNFSDHYCILLELEFNPLIDKPIDRYTWRFDENKDHLFRKKISEYMEKWMYFYTKFKDNIKYFDKLVTLFQLYIFNAANEIYGIKKYNICSYF